MKKKEGRRRSTQLQKRGWGGGLQGRARTWIQGGKGGPEVTLFVGDVASEATC